MKGETMMNLEKYGIIQGREKPYEEALYSIALIYNICNNDISKFLKDYGLTIGKLNVLVAIRTHSGPEGISQVDVSKHLIVTPANMTKLNDKLEKEKLVTRSPLEGDRRVNMLKVTKRAEELLDGLWPKYNEKMKQMMGKLSISDQKEIASKLIKWLGVLLDN